MRNFIGFTKRNLLIYFKDRQSIFFSMLTPIIVFLLYMFFLKGNYVDAMEGAAAGLENFIEAKDIEALVNALLLSGLLGSSMITVPYNTLCTIVKDRENRIDYDICATPMGRVKIILAYFVASAISAFVMSAAVLTAGLIIMACQGILYLGAANVFHLYAITLLGAISATALFMIVVLFFKSSSASGAFFGLLSAGAGFIIGAYIPIAQFSDGVQTFCNIFPGSGITILFRNELMEPILNKINEGIGGVDEGLFADTIREIFGFTANMFGHTIETKGIIWWVLAVAFLSILAIIIIYPRIYKRK